MSRQRVPLGKAARATRRVSSGGEVGSSGWSDIDQLTRATGRILNTADHALDRFANPLKNDFATSVTVGAGPICPAVLNWADGWDCMVFKGQWAVVWRSC